MSKITVELERWWIGPEPMAAGRRCLKRKENGEMRGDEFQEGDGLPSYCVLDSERGSIVVRPAAANPATVACTPGGPRRHPTSPNLCFEFAVLGSSAPPALPRLKQMLSLACLAASKLVLM